MSKALAVFFCPRTHWQHLRNLTDWTFLTLVVLYGFVFQNARTIIQTLSMSVIPNSGKSPSVHLSVGCHHSWLSKMVSILVSLVTQFTVSDRAVSRFRFLYREKHLGVMFWTLCRFSLANVVPQKLPCVFAQCHQAVKMVARKFRASWLRFSARIITKMRDRRGLKYLTVQQNALDPKIWHGDFLTALKTIGSTWRYVGWSCIGSHTLWETHKAQIAKSIQTQGSIICWIIQDSGCQFGICHSSLLWRNCSYATNRWWNQLRSESCSAASLSQVFR